MSVAAMTMDDQRQIMNSYEKATTTTLHISGSGGAASALSGPASPTPSAGEELTMPQQQQQYMHHHHHHHHHHIQHNTTTPSPTTTKNHHLQQQHQQQQHFGSTTVASLLSNNNDDDDGNNFRTTATTAAGVAAAAEHRQRILEEEIEQLKHGQQKLSQQCVDAQRREKILMRRLANKEQEFQDYVAQIAEFKAAQAPNAMALRTTLLDPAVNLIFEKLKKELQATKAKLEETQNELSAWKFTPDSNTGKRLMAKCRLLYQENEELGKMTSNGRLAKLETELAMQKSFSDEVKKSQSELDEILQDLDEDVEGMQSTILFLQQELKQTRDRIQLLEKENCELKNGKTKEQQLNGENALIKKEKDESEEPMPRTKQETTSEQERNKAIYATMGNGNPNEACHHQHHFQQQLELDNSPIATPTEALNPNLQNTFNDYYNGNANEALNMTTTVTTIHHTMPSRKRPYDVTTIDSNIGGIVAISEHEPLTLAQQQATAPRTLPPKKSKLRMTPARRASIQSLEMNEMVGGTSSPLDNMGSAGLATPAYVHAYDNMPHTTHVYSTTISDFNSEDCSSSPAMLIVDDGMDGGNSNSGSGSSSASCGGSSAGAAQRIMTRRRSSRNHQNGAGGGGGGIGIGDDTNH